MSNDRPRGISREEAQGLLNVVAVYDYYDQLERSEREEEEEKSARENDGEYQDDQDEEGDQDDTPAITSPSGATRASSAGGQLGWLSLIVGASRLAWTIYQVHRERKHSNKDSQQGAAVKAPK